MRKNFICDLQKGVIPLLALLVAVPLLLVAGGITYYLRVAKPKTLITPTIFQHSPQNNQPTGEIKIIDGSVCSVENGQTKILVDKNNWQAVSVEYFSDVSVSPDGTKLCFLAHTIQPTWLFWSKIDGSDVTKIQAVAKNCLWSHDSKNIAFNNQTSDVSAVDVYTYNTQTADLVNQTGPSNRDENVFRNYQDPQWQEGDTKIQAKYTVFSFDNPNSQKTGTVLIDVTTHAVEDQ